MPSSIIILTEYDMTLRNVLSSALSQNGHLVYSFRAGLEAIECARLGLANLVILDGLAAADGLAACARIRELEGYAGIPIVLTTWNESAAFKRDAQRAGASKLLFRPFSKNEFLESVHEFVAEQQEADAQLLGLLKHAVVWSRPRGPEWQDSPTSPLGRSRQYLELIRRLGL